MARLFGLDYGTKRVGIAETDDLQIIASPLITVHSKDVVNYIHEYSQKYKPRKKEKHGKNILSVDVSELDLIGLLP